MQKLWGEGMSRHEQTQIVFDGVVRAISFTLICFFIASLLMGFFEGLGVNKHWGFIPFAVIAIYLHHFFKRVLK